MIVPRLTEGSQKMNRQQCTHTDTHRLRPCVVSWFVVPYSIRTRAPGVQCFEPRKLVAMNQARTAAQRSAACTYPFGGQSDGGSGKQWKTGSPAHVSWRKWHAPVAENCAEPTDCWVSLQGHDALVLLSRPFHLSAPAASLARAPARGVTPWRSLTGILDIPVRVR